MTRTGSLARIVCALTIALAAVACGDKSRNPLSPSATPTLQSVQIVGKQQYVVGESFQLHAIAKYSDGTEQQVTAQAEWAHFNSGAIDVSPTGMLHALEVGRCGVVATFQGMSGKLAVQVLAAPPEGPGDPGPGGPENPGVPPTTNPPGNNPPPPPPAAPSIIGLAVQGDPIVTVGQTVAWRAIALFNDGSQQTVTSSATWTSAASGVASVNAGVITGVSAGTASIGASYRGHQAAGVVTVTNADEPPPTVTSLSITGNTTVEVGQTSQLHAVAHLSNGSTLPVTASASWSSSNSGVASVVGGLVSATTAGTTTITATYLGQSASVTFEVTAATVTSLTVSGATSLQVGQSTQWQAVAHYSNGGSQNVTNAASWSSGTPSVASVAGGLVTAQSAGSSVISASFGGRSGNDTVTVTAAPPTAGTITISGTPCSVVGQTAQLTAMLNGQNVTAQVAWSSSNNGIASIAGSGLLTCASAGSATITAAMAPHTSGTLAVSVSAAPVDLIGLEVQVDGNVLTGNGPLGLPLTLAQLLNGNPLLDLTVFGLYSDNSRQEVTSLATVNCPTVPNPLVPCILGLDGMGTIDVVALLLRGLLDPTHPVNVTYGGYTANLVVNLNLPVLQSLNFKTASANLVAGNKLPSLAGLLSQGITSDIDASLPVIGYEIQLADAGLVGLINAIPLVGPGLVSTLNTVLGGVSVVGGVLELTGPATTALNSLLNNPLVTALLGSDGLLPLEVSATIDGVRTNTPLLVKLGK